jgi:hypothetical protein
LSTRYFTNMAIALLAGFLVVVSFAFTATVGAWIAFGVAIGILGIALLAQIERKRGQLQRILDAVVVTLAVATIVTTSVYTAPVVAWIFFGEALGLVGLSVAGLTFHEIERWRAEHGMAELRVLHRAALARTTGEGRLAA